MSIHHERIVEVFSKYRLLFRGGDKVMPETIELYAGMLEKYPPEAVGKSLSDLAKRSVFFPALAEIIQGIEYDANTAESIEDRARVVAARIWEGLQKFPRIRQVMVAGDYRTEPDPEKIKSFVGEVGWSVIKTEGGWNAIHESAYESNGNIMKAQWRELAMAMIRRNNAGVTSVPSFNDSHTLRPVGKSTGMIPAGNVADGWVASLPRNQCL